MKMLSSTLPMKLQNVEILSKDEKALWENENIQFFSVHFEVPQDCLINIWQTDFSLYIIKKKHGWKKRKRGYETI